MSGVAGKIFKLIKALLIGVITLSAIGSTGYFAHQWYNTKFWTAPEKLHGISLGMSRSDVLFYQEKNTKYFPPDSYETSSFIVIQKEILDSSKFFVMVWFDEGDSVYIIELNNLQESDWHLKTPFKNTETLLNAFGEPDLFAISSDSTQRRYTYLDKGYTFEYEHDELKNFMLGNVKWRSFSVHNQKYFIMGKQICPSTDCPWDKEGNMKKEFEDRDYRYFLN